MVQVNVITPFKGSDDELYNSFEKDYCGSRFSVSELKEKYQLSEGRYKKIRKEVEENTGYKRKAGRRSYKYIDYVESRGKYRVYKTLDGDFHLFGYYQKKEDAVRVRDKLLSVDWDLGIWEKIKNDY